MKTIHKVLIIFLFSLLTHMPGIRNPILDYHGWAQTLRASIARNYYEGDMNFFKPRVDYQGHNPKHSSTQFPLYSYLVALLYKIFGVSEVWGRILSALFAALSAVVLYFIVREFFDDRIAFFSGLFFCVIPLRIYFMRTFMPESMAIFSLLAGFWYALRWDKEKKFLPHGFLCGFFLTLSFLLKIPYLFMILPVLYLNFNSAKINLKRIFILLIFLLIGVGSWYQYALQGTGGLSVENQPFLYETNIPWEWLQWEFWSTQFLSRFPELLTTYSGLVFLMVGLWVAFKKKKSFIVVWFFSGIIYLLLCGRYGRIHQYAALPLTPIHSVLMAVGFFFLWDRCRKKWVQTLLILLVLAVPLHAGLRIKHWYRCEEKWVVEARAVVEKISLSTDLFYIDAPDHPFFLYHLHRKGFTQSLYPYGSIFFEETIAQGLKYYFIPGKKSAALEDPNFLNRFRLLHEAQNFVIYELISHKNHG